MTKEINNNSQILELKDITVDLSMIFQISGNDRNFIVTMISTFLQNMPQNLQQIEEHFEKKDWDSLYKAAHYAKSSLSIIKISGMHELMYKIELNAKNKIDVDTIATFIEKAKQIFSVAEELLTQEIASN